MSSKKKGRKTKRADETSAAGQAPQDSLGAMLASVREDSRKILAGDERRVQRVLETLRGPLGVLLIQADKVQGPRRNVLPLAACIADSSVLLALRLSIGRDVDHQPHLPEGGCLPSIAVTSRSPGCLDVALTAGADPNRLNPDNSMRPLHQLAVTHPVVDASFPLVARRAPRGEAALLAGVRSMAQRLKEAGADITADYADPEASKCPVVHAIGLRQLSIAAVLCDVFASPPASQAQQMDWGGFVRALLELQIKRGDRERQLERAGAVQLLAAIQRGWQPGGSSAAASAEQLSAAAAPADVLQPDSSIEETGAEQPGGCGAAAHAEQPAGAAEPDAVAELLEKAVACGCLLTVLWLLQAADAQRVRRTVKLDCQPLWRLVLLHNKRRLLLALLEQCPASLEPTACDDGRSLLSFAVQEGGLDLLDELSTYASEPVLRQLLEARHEVSDYTALGDAVNLSHGEAVARLLQACREAGLDFHSLLAPQSMQRQGLLPIISSIATGYWNPLQRLLAAGLDLRSAACVQHVLAGEVGRSPADASVSLTPLMAAACMGRLPAIRLLLEAGADPREAGPEDRAFPSPLAAALSDFRLRDPVAVWRPLDELQTHAEAWLRHWQLRVLEGDCPGRSPETPPQSAAMSAWLAHWPGGKPGLRFACVLQLLWSGGGLTQHQLGRLLVLLAACQERDESQEADALEVFLYRRLQPCAWCGLLGRWRRCACKRAWYCGRACQKQHWKAGHERECTLASRPRPE